MKIGIFSPYLDSLAGGERYMLTIAACLSNKNKVEIFWSDLDIKKKAEERFLLDLSKVKIVKDMFGIFERIKYSKAFDLIIFLSDGSIPVTFAKQNIIHFQVPFTNVSGRSFLNKLKLGKFGAIICNSKFTKQFIDREYGVASRVIYPPVDIDRFKPLQKNNTILSVGRFHPFKKQDLLIKCFKNLASQVTGWEMIIVGGLLDQDKQYFKKLKAMAKDSNIQLVPNVEFNTLKRLYGQAKILWHAAGFGENEDKTPQAMEHFGITTVEAMAAGCVPISFRGGGQKEIISHAKNGFLWERIDELTKYTLELARNEELRRKMVKQARNDSHQFSVERFCREINEAVEAL